MINVQTIRSMQIKGIKDGLLIPIGEGEWDELQSNLISQIEKQSSFFNGARLALDVGNQVLHVIELGKLRDQLSDHGVRLFAIISNSTVTENTARLLGLSTCIKDTKVERIIRNLNTQVDGEDAILIQRTLRSGFNVNFGGHVIVIGDVNPGAEIKAGGNIIVWGRLGGRVHAGQDGDVNAVICALEFAPNLIRINEQVFSIPTKMKKGIAQMAILKEGKIEILNWEKN
jgi:septum site-determining protein MinC